MTGAPREKRVFYLWSAFWVSEFRCTEFRYPEFRCPEETAGRMKERLVFDEYAVEKMLVACKAEFDPFAKLIQELLGDQSATPSSATPSRCVFTTPRSTTPSLAVDVAPRAVVFREEVLRDFSRDCREEKRLPPNL